jgi:hypothetical protein
MHRPIPAGRRGYAVTVHASVAAVSAAVLTPILLLASCTQPSNVQHALIRYDKATAAYDGCRAHRPQHCDSERAAYQAARDEYHAVKDVQP